MSAAAFQRQCFMQDGAIPHQTNETIVFLLQKFRRVLSLCMENEWSLHSPDLYPLDFFLWGACKDNVYKEHPRSEPDLKAAVEAYVQTVSIKTCRNVTDNLAIRVKACCVRGDAHIEHLNYKRIKRIMSVLSS